MPRVEKTVIEHVNYYDSIGLANGYSPSGWVNGAKLFGNSNVGDLHRTNMQMSGQFPPRGDDQPVVIQRWYARTNVPMDGELGRALALLMHSAVATFVIGNRPRWQSSLFELLERRPRTVEREDHALRPADPWPEVVPVRQNVTVHLDRFGEAALDSFVRVLATHEEFNSNEQFSRADGTPLFLPPVVTAPRLWVHLEGVSCPPRVAERIATAMVARRSVEEDVAAWIMGVAKDPRTTDATQLVAIADGILEGKHRGL